MDSIIHHEVDEASFSCLRAYLIGTLADGTRSKRHGTYRIGQSERVWLELLQRIFGKLGFNSWIYREGATRNFWIIETTANFLTKGVGSLAFATLPDRLAFARGFFDADGGMPRHQDSRLYLQFSQKDPQILNALIHILAEAGIVCGSLHNPSSRVDPHYWRFFVRACSHEPFMSRVGSWHPIKRVLIEERLSRLPEPRLATSLS